MGIAMYIDDNNTLKGGIKMKSIKWTVLAVLVLFCSGAYANIADSIAVINSHSGKVMITSGSKTKSPEVNMPLYQGDTVSTFSRSSIEIVFDDATIVRLPQNSEITLTELKRKGSSAVTVFNLAKGALLAIVDKLKSDDSRFEIHTKMAIAAVKGTEFAISAEGSSPALGVYEGAVEFRGNRGSVMVKAGSESTFDPALGRPLNPARINRTAAFAYEIGNMRNEINVIRELKQRGDGSVIQYRIKKQKTVDGEVKGTSETDITIGGANDNIKSVSDEIKNRLDRNAKNELSRVRGHAAKDLGHITGEMKADIHLGKTMTDRHGNRIRIEEFVFRPKDADGLSKQVDLLSVTLRDNRLDYMRAENVFVNEIPERLTRLQWSDMWKHEWNFRTDKPWNYLSEQRIKLSNSTDWVFIGTAYMPELWATDAVGSNYNNYQLLKDQDIVAFGSGEISGDMTIAGFTAPGAANINPNSEFVREQRIYAYRDPLGSGYLRNDPVTGDQNAVLRGPLDKTYASYDDYSMVKAAYTNSYLSYPEYSQMTGSMNIESNDFISYTEQNTLLGTERELGFAHTRNYNDGSHLTVNLALIDDYGTIMKLPDPGTKPLALAFWALDLLVNSNVEASFNSNVFEDQGLGIDVVSKMLWWIMLNPKSDTSPSPEKNTSLNNI